MLWYFINTLAAGMVSDWGSDLLWSDGPSHSTSMARQALSPSVEITYWGQRSCHPRQVCRGWRATPFIVVMMSSGQIFSDVNLLEPKRNTFLPYCLLDAVGGMSFTLVPAVHYQRIDFADADLICGPGSRMSVCRSKHFMTLEAGAPWRQPALDFLRTGMIPRHVRSTAWSSDALKMKTHACCSIHALRTQPGMPSDYRSTRIRL